MPEFAPSESVEPLPSKHKPGTFGRRVEEFHLATQGGEKNNNVTIQDDRDPFAWSTRFAHGKHHSQSLYNLMWAAYRLVGTLPSEDEVKFRDSTPMDPESEAAFMKTLDAEALKVLADYQEFLVKSSLEQAAQAERPPAGRHLKISQDQIAVAIIEHVATSEAHKEAQQ